MWATLEHLIVEGCCPLKIENLDKWRHYSKEEARKNNNGGRVYPVDDAAFDAWIKLDFDHDGKPDYKSPYQLRKEIAEVKLDLNSEANRYKLGRCLYHISQRRGFKSSRKSADENKEEEISSHEIIDLQFSEKKKNKTITDLFEKYPEAKTIGSLFALLENDGLRIRENIAQFAIRENFKEEIKYIFQVQGMSLSDSIYCKLVETGKGRNDGSIFYKRPLRSQKGLIGKCTLEPNKYRAPISHPSFEIFRAWSFLNNIKYKPLDTMVAQWLPVPLDLKLRIYKDKFFRKSKTYFPFSEIAELIKKEGYKWDLNYKPKTTVNGCPISARLKEIFGEDYLNIRIPKTPSTKAKKDFYNIEDIWHILFSFEDQEKVVEFAEIKLGLDLERTKQFVTAWNTTPVGYAMLSLNAISKINTFLLKGLIYTEAVLLAKIPELLGKTSWTKNESLFVEKISLVIQENREQKTILNIVNSLISKHKNLPDSEKFEKKNNNYKLVQSDLESIKEGIQEQFGASKWTMRSEGDQKTLFSIVRDCYQAYFIATGLERKDISNERHFVIKSNSNIYYKGDSGYYRLPKLKDTLAEFLQSNFGLDDSIENIYHPSEINIYPPAKSDKNGVLKLGSPKTGSFKNPMAMRALHELRRLINYLIESNQIDSETRIIVEVARDLNDANKRWAINAWQRQREGENTEFALAIEQLINEEKGVQADSKNANDIDKIRLWYEQNNEESVPPIAEGEKEIKGIKWAENKKDSYREITAKKEMIAKYRLWREQNCQCLYTGRIIKITDLFRENVIDFEHTIPRSLSFDNSLANLTVCYADYNRTVKKNQIPFQLDNYEEILLRIGPWMDKVERIRQQIDFWKTKSKKATDKKWKDDAIRQRHLWQMELDYWKNKVDRFTMEEITSGFKNSQKIDTQLISKYAFHYLKTYFERVDVQKGSITAEFRKIYGLQAHDEKKDRSKHSHHAKDAAVLTLIPGSIKRDEILKTYYEHQERKQSYTIEPYYGFKREFVWGIDDSVLINNVTHNQVLTPSKKIIRKRGKIQFIEGTNKPKIATGDCIRGQLHDETFFGAIKPAKRGKNGNILRDDDGKIMQEKIIQYVVRTPFQYKKDDSPIGFKTLEDIEKQIVDEGLKKQIKDQVLKAGGLKEAFEQGIYMLNKNGDKVNKIRHIRIFKAATEPLQIKKQTNLSKHDYKQFYYASNASNVAYGLYKSPDETKVSYKIIDLFTASKINKLTASGKLELENEIRVKKNILTLEAILTVGQKVIFFSKSKSELQQLSLRDLSKRIYKIEGFEKDGRIRFMHHLNSIQENDLKKLENQFGKAIYQGFSSLNFEIPWPKLKLSIGNLKMAIENKDFKTKIDGNIDWI